MEKPTPMQRLDLIDERLDEVELRANATHICLRRVMAWLGLKVEPKEASK